jgi:signal transduction histidine kinase
VPIDLETGRGVGLGDRTGALDGELTVTSRAGEGTTLHAAIPLG